MTLAELRHKRSQILQLAEAHGATNLRVFGSVARSEATDASDVDLLVDFDPARVSWGGGAFLVELEALLGCNVDVVTVQDLHPLIRERVMAEAVAL